MNKYTCFLIVFMSGLFVRCATGEMSSDPIAESGHCLPDVADRYEYPVVPGTTQWASASDDEKLALVQMPDEKLESLSSHALIQSLLDKPLLAMSYMLSSNSSPIGTCNRFIFSGQNSVAEFEKRKNRVDALLSYYEAVGCDCYNAMDETDRRTFSIQLCVLDVWFTRDAILRSLDEKQKQQVVALLLQKYRQRLDVTGAYSVGALTAMAWIMYDDRYAPVVSYYGTVSSNEYFMVLLEQIKDITAFAENYTR